MTRDPASNADLPEALWQVRLLGGLDLSNGQQRLHRLPSRAATALLARLAIWPTRAHAREELIEALWPDVGLSVGRNRLRQVLSTLKSILEPAGRVPPQPVLVADRTSVRVTPAALACDVVQFEQHARGGRVDAARALYRGELLPGFYDEWIDEERQRLSALHERLPTRTEVAQQPQRGTPPAQLATAVAVRVTLPIYLTQLIGAEAQAAQLLELVRVHRLVTLVGPGGAGKTRLAVEAAHALRDSADKSRSPAQAFDLIAFVSLVTCTTRAQACDALTVALQITPGVADPLLAVTEALAGRRALLVLDNFEQLVGLAEDLVAYLMGRLPGLHVVLTSRRALGLDGEREFAVAALELPAADAAFAAAAGNPAVGLYVDRARAVRADFHLSERNFKVLVELVRALEGMPLAIELAASRARSMAPAAMLARLRGMGMPGLDLLARSGPRGAFDPRHASMQRAIEWSWNLLQAEQARLLAALTVFAGGFSAASAIALVGDGSIDTELLLDDLLAHSLLHAHTADDGELRFGLYQPIREFAASQQDDATARHWRERLRAWALTWALALPSTPPLVALRTEMPNLLAALASAVNDRAAADAIQLLLALRRCLEDVELPAEGLLHAQAAVEQCTDGLLKARGHSLLAPLLFVAGHSDAALQHAELGASSPLLDADQRARALHALARVRWRSRRNAAEVEPLLAEAEALTAESADIELRASLLALRAFVTNTHHRDLVAGEKLHAQALALWQQQGNQHAINSGRYNLAVCAQNAGRHHDAIVQLASIITSAVGEQDWRRLSQSLNVRGNAYSGLRQWARAGADYQQCIRTAWQGMASFDLAYGLWNLPPALAHLRQPENALRLMACAAALWRARFGELSAQDRRDVRRVRRLVARQIEVTRIEPLWREGEQLSLSQAVALALTPIGEIQAGHAAIAEPGISPRRG